MDKPRPCGCKGCRTCLVCESEFGIQQKNLQIPKDNSYVYCPLCEKAWPGWDYNIYKLHPNHEGEPIDYPGVYIDLNFLSEDEESQLIKDIDNEPWDLSQSGRRKQNYGPKCNFKKKKLRIGDFKGFPKFSRFVQDKFDSVPILEDFQTIEQCSLEYDPKKGASIDPHIDDCWIWGERIVTVNLLADSVLTMTFNEKSERYNLDLVSTYPVVVDKSEEKIPYNVQKYQTNANYGIVRIPMPRRSLLVMFGAARYDWEHQILREDIGSRRVCLAYREFTPPYLQEGEKYGLSEEVFHKAKEFW